MPRGSVARADAAAARGRVPWTWIAAVAAIAVAVYGNTVGGTLLYDDVNAIRDNAFVLDGDVVGILTTPSWWANGRGGLWRPLTTLTFVGDHALHGLDPVGYHVVNVVLHAAVSVLVLVVFAAAMPGARTALGAAVLFATHPIHTEAVANVVGRAELLAAAGFFLAWWAWLRADAAARPRAAGGWLAAAVLAYGLAMCGKENAIALPAVLFLADVLARGEPIAVLARRRAPRYAALLAVAVAFVAARSAVIGGVAPATDLLDNPLSTMAPVPRLLTAIAVLGRYALRLLFPLWLSADYSFDQIPAVTTPLDVGFLAGFVAVAGVCGLVWWARRRAPVVALGLGMLALTFVVVSNLFFVIGTIMGERLAYLPSAGFCLAMAGALARLGRQRDAPAARTTARWAPAFVVPIAVVASLYAARTITRNAVWREPIGFFSRMVVDAPRSARSHRELGTALAAVGRFDEARREFDLSLAIKPDDATTLYNLGNALSGEGRYDAAADAYRRAVAANPTFTRALENLGNAESMRGDQTAALAALRRARELDPASPTLVMNIANTLFRAGSIADARAAYEEALALAPRSPEILTNYGSFLYAQNDFAAAVRVFERIPPPAPARALVPLAASYRVLGRSADARATQATAERLYPRDPGVRQLAEFMQRSDAAAKGAAP